MNQADKKRNVKSNGAAATKPVRNQGKPPHGDKSTVSNSVGREHSRDERDSRPPNAQGIYHNARFVHACAALVGHVVQVRLKDDNDVYIGIFHTISPDLKIALQAVHAVSRSAVEKSSSLAARAPDHLASLLYEMDSNHPKNLNDAMIFSLNDVVSMTACDIDMDYATKETAFTDSQISGANGHVQHRDLQEWVGDDEDCEIGDLEKTAGVSSWTSEQMFELNAEKFAVKSSYKQNLEGYTYQIEPQNTAEYHERERLATKLANEIESQPKNKRRIDLEIAGDDEDEERKFSAVVRDGGRQDRQDRDGRYNNPNNRRSKPPTNAINGMKGGPQRSVGPGNVHQRSTQNRSPPAMPATQSLNRKESDTRKTSERSPGARTAVSPKPDGGKRESPILVSGQQHPHHAQNSPPQGAQHQVSTTVPLPPVAPRQSPIESRKKTPTPPLSVHEESKGKLSPREPSPPSPSPAKTSASPDLPLSTDDIVKKSKLNPNAEDFVPKAPEVTHHKSPAMTMHMGGNPRNHLPPQNSMITQHIHAGGHMMATNQYIYHNAGQHTHSSNHQRPYRPPKGSRQSDALQVAGPSLLAGPPHHQNILMGFRYPSQSPSYTGGPGGVQANVVMSPQMPQPVQVVPLNQMIPPTRSVMSPPGGSTYCSSVILDSSLPYNHQGTQVLLRDIPAPFCPPFDGSVFVLSSPQPNQTGNPSSANAGNGPHGHHNQAQISYAGQPPWNTSLLMMNSLSGPGTPPPPHPQLHHMGYVQQPPPVHNGGGHGHVPQAHGHAYAPATVVQTPVLQVQGGGMPSPSAANPNVATLNQPPQTTQPQPPSVQSAAGGQQTGPQQPPSQQTQQP